ncbi:hypothetical protein [Chitiniphilus eburneus]|uniref:Uncharacterized protein n=1 Tax=Chitiniphilus eburneus TaxID=2571148 RepID=A0A4U0PVZ1_9NEIS|nr:hypothetical protein [Chitiniphilus eburneus]TJZ71712.1 hypothetical protein FAZ21_13475 [Chitiniphilus eburneus]
MLVASATAYAQRLLPPQGQLGELKAYSPAAVKIDNKQYTAAPGLRIYSTQNTLVMPGAVPLKVQVWYQLESSTGFIWRIWVLDAAEYELLKSRAKPTPTPRPTPTPTPTN